MLKPRKAEGHDVIQNENVLYAGSNSAVHLSLLFNCLLGHAFVPDDLCFGNSKPLLKTKHGDQSKPEMYRGITALSVTCQITCYL